MDLYPGWGLTESAASRTAEYHTPGKHGAGGVFLLTDKDGYNFGPVNSPGSEASVTLDPIHVRSCPQGHL